MKNSQFYTAFVTSLSMLGVGLLGACGVAPATDSPEIAAPAAEGSKESQVAPLPTTNKKFVDATAFALRDPSSRMVVKRAMDASPVKENKVHLGSFLRGAGAPMFEEIKRKLDLPRGEVDSIDKLADSMEMYLPVEEHRVAWSGDEDLIIATQLDEGEEMYGVRLDGEVVALSEDEWPETPVLAIVPKESFGEDGVPYQRDAQQPSFSGSPNAFVNVPGLWVTKVTTVSKFEPWIKGKPEFEMHLATQSGSTRTDVTCAEQDSIAPYQWDMNGTSYSTPFLLVKTQDVPMGVPLMIYLYEDDDERCVVKTDKDYVGLTLQVLAGAQAGYGLATAKKVNNQTILDIYNGIVAILSFFKTGDDFVGVASVGSTDDDIGSSTRQLTLKNNSSPKGTVELHWGLP